MDKPPRVDDVTACWTTPPPVRSARCDYWLARFAQGWTRNRRLSRMGYHESAEFFGVYIWEYFHVLMPVEAPEAYAALVAANARRHTNHVVRLSTGEFLVTQAGG